MSLLLETTMTPAHPMYAVFFDGDENVDSLRVEKVLWFEVIRCVRPDRTDYFEYRPMGLADPYPFPLDQDGQYLGLSETPEPQLADFEPQIRTHKEGFTWPRMQTKVPAEVE